MVQFFFFLKHTPFWAIPIILISLEFAYFFWLKKQKTVVAFSLVLALFCSVFLGFYVWAGGPEKAVKKVKFFIHHDV